MTVLLECLVNLGGGMILSVTACRLALQGVHLVEITAFQIQVLVKYVILLHVRFTLIVHHAERFRVTERVLMERK